MARLATIVIDDLSLQGDFFSRNPSVDPELPVRLVGGFLSASKADSLLSELLGSVKWEQQEISIYGRRLKLPRLTAWYGDPGTDYVYSGLRNRPKPWTPSLASVREAVSEQAGVRFNSVLLNLYRNGRDKLSWHSDNESEIDPLSPIGSLSVGETRKFQVRRASRKSPIFDIHLRHGDLLIMDPGMQDRWMHQIPMDGSSKPRINLTFRVVRGAGRNTEGMKERDK